MTPQEEIALNGKIAVAMYGWKKNDNGQWIDPGGDVYPTPPDYNGNFGWTYSLKCKVRNRNLNVNVDWPSKQSATITLSNDSIAVVGVGVDEPKAMAVAVGNLIDAMKLV